MRKEYVRRNNRLRSLGFDSYPAYLSSSLWYAIRRRVLERDHCICRSCKVAAATQVHHADYEVKTLRGETIERLFSVCEGCHHRGEFDGDRKTSLWEANQRLGFAKVKPPKPKKSGKKLSKAQRRAITKERERVQRADFMAHPEVVAARIALDEYRRKLRKPEYEVKLAAWICKRQAKEAGKKLPKPKRKPKNPISAYRNELRKQQAKNPPRPQRTRLRDSMPPAEHRPFTSTPTTDVPEFGLYAKLNQLRNN